MKKFLLGFILGILLMFFVSIGLSIYFSGKQQIPKEKQELVDIVQTYSELESKLYNNARKEFKDKNYSKALEYITISDKMSRALHYKNNDYQKDSEAFTCLNKLIEINNKIKANPNDYRLYYERANLQDKPDFSFFSGETYTFCSDYDSAYNDYTKITELNPEAKDVYEKRADTLFNKNKYIQFKQSLTVENKEQIIKDYQKAIELNGKSDELLNKLSAMYYYNEQYEEAIDIIKNNNLDEPYGLMLSYEKLKEYDKVVENADKLLAKRDQRCAPPDDDCKWWRKFLYRKRANANFKLHKYKEWFKDLKSSF